MEMQKRWKIKVTQEIFLISTCGGPFDAIGRKEGEISSLKRIFVGEFWWAWLGFRFSSQRWIVNLKVEWRFMNSQRMVLLPPSCRALCKRFTRYSHKHLLRTSKRWQTKTYRFWTYLRIKKRGVRESLLDSRISPFTSAIKLNHLKKDTIWCRNYTP